MKNVLALIFVALMGLGSVHPEPASVLPSQKAEESSAFRLKIGKAHHHNNPATATLRTTFPLDSKLVDIFAEFGNEPWGHGESDYGTSAYSAAPLNGYKDKSGEWHKGWARAELVEIGSNDKVQYVIVKFSTWKHDNSRRARVRVKYAPF